MELKKKNVIVFYKNTCIYFVNIQLPRHYLQFPEGFILVYDPCDASSLDMLAGIKNDVDKNKDKKEVIFY